MKKVITIFFFFTAFACKKEEPEETFTCQQCLITTGKTYTTKNCGDHVTRITTQSRINDNIKSYNRIINYPDGISREFKMSCSKID